MLTSVEGLQEELQAMQRFADAVMPVVSETLEDGTKLIVQDIQHYPDERPQQTYMRTGDFGNFTHYQMTPGMDYVASQIDMPVDYAKWVRGNLDGYLGPAYMHKGRWDNVTEITNNRVPAIESNLEGNLAAKAQEAGL